MVKLHLVDTPIGKANALLNLSLSHGKPPLPSSALLALIHFLYPQHIGSPMVNQLVALVNQIREHVKEETQIS